MDNKATRRVVATALTLLLFFPCLVDRAVAQSQHTPGLMVFPTEHHPNEPAPLRETCLYPDDWPTGWSRAFAFGNADSFWAAWTNNNQVAQCLTNLRNAGMELWVEVGVLKDHCTTAAACWNNALPILRRLENLGASQMTLVLDEPLTGSEPYASYSYVVDQTGYYIELARDEFPAVAIVLEEAYPHWPKNTLKNFYRDVNAQAINRTGWGIQYASLDHDWTQGGSKWHVFEIQQYVRAYGMGFEVIFWNAAHKSQGWEDGLIDQGEQYQAWRNIGVDPDVYAIQNWTGKPTETLSEWDQGSFTNSVRDFVHRFLPVASLEPGERLYPGQSVKSADGRFKLLYQSDGNLVLYRIGAGALWSSGTNGTSLGYAVMQGDGNLVVYDAGHRAVWASNTWGNSNALLVVQSDGNLVIYSDYYNEVLWASDTDCC